MTNKIIRVAFTALLILPFLISVSQPSIDKYYIVTLKGDIVRKTLDTYPEFSYFDFTYFKLTDNNYSLAGYAKDETGQQLGGEIMLIPMINISPRKFKNLEKGHLYLYLTTMKEHDVDGSEDYVLTPKKCKDRTGADVDYVSYRFSNKIEPSSGFISAALVLGVKSFNLNPSPPY